MNRVRFLGVLVLALSLSWISSPSYAQAPPVQNSETGSSTGPEGGGLTEIVVTAQKREQTLNEVPISIAAYSQETRYSQNRQDPFPTSPP